MNPTEMIEALRAQGYFASTSNDGSERVQLDGAQHGYIYANPGDSLTDKRQYMRAPTVAVAVLELSVSEVSPLATKFLAELLKLVAPADRLLKKHVRPLVRTTATTLHAVYRAETTYVQLLEGLAHRRMFEHGLQFADSGSFTAPAQLSAHCGSMPFDGGSWHDERSPLTVKRDELPTWDVEAMPLKLREFVDGFIATGELREAERYREPPRAPAFAYRESSEVTLADIMGRRRG